jgi:MGT family glycosyltransferase
MTIAGTGHLNAMTALARRLGSRGHEVIFLSALDGERAARDAGLRYEPYCEAEFPLGYFEEVLRKLSVLTGPEALKFTVEALGTASRAVIVGLPPVLARLKLDGLVADNVAFGSNVAAMLAGVPFVTVFCTPILDYSGGMPPWQTPWPYEDSDAARQRNLKGVAGFLKLIGPTLSAQVEHLQKAGITVDASNPEWTRSPLACITQVPAAFDFPGDHLLPHYHRTGPFHDGRGRAEVLFPWERLTGEPLIYASMGSVMHGLREVFQSILLAAERSGYQVVLSMGSQLQAEELKTSSASTILVAHAPQLELLKKAALCITHAGLNTTLESLAHGVPLVAVPISNDQPGVAARILASGTGLFVPLPQLTGESLHALVDTVLGDPAYRERAMEMKSAIENCDGLTMAAEIIEAAFGSAALA